MYDLKGIVSVCFRCPASSVGRRREVEFGEGMRFGEGSSKKTFNFLAQNSAFWRLF